MDRRECEVEDVEVEVEVEVGEYCMIGEREEKLAR